MEEDKALAVANVPKASGPCVSCEGCWHTCPGSEDCTHDSHDAVKKKFAAAKQDVLGSGYVSAIGSGGESAAEDEAMMDKGALHKAASSVLLNTLYAARLAIPDRLRPTTRLA